MTPRTAAGRSLLDWVRLVTSHPRVRIRGDHDPEGAILAIEAEALAAARERIERMTIWVTYQHPEGPTGDADPVEFETIDRAAVLAALAAPSDAPELRVVEVEGAEGVIHRVWAHAAPSDAPEKP